MNKLKEAGDKICVTYLLGPLFLIKPPMMKKTNKGTLSQTKVPLTRFPTVGIEFLLCAADTALAYTGHIPVQGALMTAQSHLWQYYS